MPPKSNRPNGRPKAADAHRIPIRYHDEDERAAWLAAAATCGLSFQAWALATLNAEAAKATHVPMIKREGRRG